MEIFSGSDEDGKKKQSFLTIERCVPAEFDRLLFRVVHQAVRNGAETVYVNDQEAAGRIEAGKAYGYYVFLPSTERCGWYVTHDEYRRSTGEQPGIADNIEKG